MFLWFTVAIAGLLFALVQHLLCRSPLPRWVRWLPAGAAAAVALVSYVWLSQEFLGLVFWPYLNIPLLLGLLVGWATARRGKPLSAGGKGGLWSATVLLSLLLACLLIQPALFRPVPYEGPGQALPRSFPSCREQTFTLDFDQSPCYVLEFRGSFLFFPADSFSLFLRSSGGPVQVTYWEDTDKDGDYADEEPSSFILAHTDTTGFSHYLRGGPRSIRLVFEHLKPDQSPGQVTFGLSLSPH